MVDITSTSHRREVVSAPPSTATTWKASQHRLVGDPLRPDYIEATPDAVWSKKDSFRYYKPLADRREADPIPPPHKPFATMSHLARAQSSLRRRTRQRQKKLYDRIRVFTHVYGLLGLFREAFTPPALPARADPLFSWVTPDALIDQAGRLDVIDPKTEGKRRLEELLDKRDGPFTAGRFKLKRKEVIWPGELRFPTLGLDYGEFGLHKSPFGWQHSSACSYEEVQERFGIRFVLDEHAPGGVSVIATREPLDIWLAELRAFQPSPPGSEYFDRALDDVPLRAVANEEGSLPFSWRCPSLLKAVHLMLYLDGMFGVKLQKCQAPDCPEYYRVGPRSRESMYCPPPLGKKESACTSRMSTQKLRERQRKI